MSNQTSVLVAMSDEQKLTYLCDQLGADGYQTVRAESTREACLRARLEPPAVVLLGELAKRHEQLRLLRAIRAGGEEASGVDPHVGVIVLAGDPGGSPSWARSRRAPMTVSPRRSRIRCCVPG